MTDILKDGKVGEMLAYSGASSTGADSSTPAGIGDDTRGDPRWQPAHSLVGLETIVWAPPVFVVGCPRSGTTLVQTMLDSHPRLSVLYEADFLVDVPLGLRSCLANASEALALAEAHPSYRTDFDARTANAAIRGLGITGAAGAMRAIAASQALAQGKKRWGNKTPKAVHHLTELATVYPDAQFIHVIRDGRDSASSQARLADRSLGEVDGALLWRTGMRTGRRAGSLLGPDRYLEVRLEELLSSPEEQIRGMCAFLGEDFNQSLLHFHTTARERIPQPDLRIHPRLGEPPRPVSSHRDSVATGMVQRAAAALIHAELAELGYVPAASPGRGRHFLYVIVGYTFFLVGLPRSLRQLFRHYARSLGARRGARSVTRSSPRGNLATTSSHVGSPKRWESRD